MSKEQETAMYDEPDYGPICCKGGCCGPGSYCCGHPDNDHDHPELEETDEEKSELISNVRNPEFDLAMWFHCLLVGHRWKWRVRLEWAGPNNGWTHALKPQGERCTRCHSERPLNIFRWFEFVNGGSMWGAGPRP